MSEHIHDCTGPDLTCSCGFVFKVGRYCVELSVYDNETKRQLVDEGFNTDYITAVVSELQKAIRNVSR